MIPHTFLNNATDADRRLVRRWTLGVGVVYSVFALALVIVSVVFHERANTVETAGPPSGLTRHPAATTSGIGSFRDPRVPASLEQTVPEDHKMATGDVWSSREALIYVPQEALELPHTVPPSDIEMGTGDAWPLERQRSSIPQEVPARGPVEYRASKQAPTADGR